MFPGLGLPPLPGEGGGGIGINLPPIGGGGTGFKSSNVCVEFPDLPGCPSSKGTTATTPTIPGTNIPLPPVLIGIPGAGGGVQVTSPTAGSAQTAASASAFGAGLVSSGLNTLFGAYTIRIVFFILGLIFIVMGLYMLKETKSIVEVPINIVKGGVKTVTEAAAAA